MSYPVCGGRPRARFIATERPDHAFRPHLYVMATNPVTGEEWCWSFFFNDQYLDPAPFVSAIRAGLRSCLEASRDIP